MKKRLEEEAKEEEEEEAKVRISLWKLTPPLSESPKRDAQGFLFRGEKRRKAKKIAFDSHSMEH